MPGGWGRRATGKIDRKLEDDALFKEIGGQLEATNFDYAQWQRTGKPSRSNIGRRPTQLQLGPDGLKSDKTVKPIFTVGGGPGSRFQRLKSVDAPPCKHGRLKKDSKSETLISAARAEQLKILKLRIDARRKTLDEYKEREQQLLTSNIQLQEEIENQEGSSHEAVKKLLRKYEKFRGGLTTLNDKFVKDLSAAQNNLTQTEKQIEADLKVLQTQVDNADLKLKDKQVELGILMSYKDKEYPVKALKISDLQKELKQLNTYQQEEQTELKRIVETEIDKLRKEQLRTRNNVTQKATESSLSQMHPSLKEMAMQNMAMQKELEFHKAEVAGLELSIKKLAEEVKKLLKDPKTSIRQQMFPEFYPGRPKCTPDMEVVLDIPTQEWLPI